MSRHDAWCDVLAELLEAHGVKLSDDALAETADGMMHHAYMEREMEGYRAMGAGPRPLPPGPDDRATLIRRGCDLAERFESFLIRSGAGVDSLDHARNERGWWRSR